MGSGPTAHEEGRGPAGVRVTGPADAFARAAPGLPGVRVRVLAGPPPDLAAAVGLIEMELDPGAALPPHTHGDAELVLHVLSGTALVASGAAQEELAGGAVLRVPPGAPVAVANPGGETLRLALVFAPEGFERRFTAWAPAPDRAEGAEARLDLTSLPRPQRHRTVIATLEALDPLTPLVVVTDHEPAPLRAQLERRYGPRLRWDVRRRTPERVEVAIRLGPAEDVGAEALVAEAGLVVEPAPARG
ncbi:DUF2249 domain-containing protein [Miltoncostaea marina]|uniref:DUF2249 domain-containing protein n=1 Tax=Miltoncostaea marina TaxID=2843215 RepID=UPI001C3E2CF9|nr:DUF2249 domain-containing protein [Miltoncostaea marina]